MLDIVIIEYFKSQYEKDSKHLSIMSLQKSDQSKLGRLKEFYKEDSHLSVGGMATSILNSMNQEAGAKFSIQVLFLPYSPGVYIAFVLQDQ